MFNVIVWDDRDRESDEPASDLGYFRTRAEAEKELADYLNGEHGAHIYKHRIVEVNQK